MSLIDGILADLDQDNPETIARNVHIAAWTTWDKARADYRNELITAQQYCAARATYDEAGRVYDEALGLR